MGTHEVQHEVFYGDAWQDVHEQVHEPSSTKITRGFTETGEMRPAKIEWTFNDPTDRWRPTNPESPLYGRVGRAMPARVVIARPGPTTVTDAFARTASSGWGSADTGQAWTTSGGAASDYSVSGGLGRLLLTSINTSRRATLAGTKTGGDARVTWTIPVDPTGDDIETSVMYHYQDATSYMQASIFWDRDGRPVELQLVRRVSGVVTQVAITHLSFSPTAASLTCSMRVQWFAGHVKIKVWPAAQSEPADWSLSALDSTWTSGQIGLRANLQPLFAGGTPQLVTVDNFSYAELTGSVRANAEAASYRPDRTPEFDVAAPRGWRWVAFTAEGMLRRLGKWTTPLRSPMTRNIGGYVNLIGHWPMEEGRGATQLVNAAPGGLPGTVTGATFGTEQTPAGASGAVKIDKNTVESMLTGRFRSASSSAGWQIAWSIKLNAIPTTQYQMIAWTTSNGYRWFLNVNDLSYNLKVVDRDGATLLDNFTGFGAGAEPNQWITFRLKATATGGTVTAELAWYPQGGATPYGISPTFAGTVGALSTWRINGNPNLINGYVAHVFGVTTGDDDLQSYAARRSFDGYVGELASDRFGRLCNEEGIVWARNGLAADTMPMGRQPADTFLNLLKEVAATDGALIYDRVSGLGLTIRTRRNLYNQTPKLALTYPSDIAPPLVEEFDDVGAANLVVVSQRNGGEAKAVDTTSAMGTAYPPVGIGEYKKTIDVNVASETSLPAIAGWHLAQGTIPGARYPTVVLDLDAHPELAVAAESIVPGDIITIAGREPDTITLMVLGIQETIQRKRRKITFTCSPGSVFSSLGVYDASRYDSKTSALAEDLTTSETAWDVTAAVLADCWTTADGPFDVRVTGEVCRVTAATAPAGSGPFTQTLTCTRSINGVVKTHAPGERIELANPARYGL